MCSDVQQCAVGTSGWLWFVARQLPINLSPSNHEHSPHVASVAFACAEIEGAFQLDCTSSTLQSRFVSRLHTSALRFAAILWLGSLLDCAGNRPAANGDGTDYVVGTSETNANRRNESSLDDIAAGFSPAIRSDIEKLRTATAPFHSLKAAQAAGYPTTTPACVDDSSMGGMGRHYFDRAIYDDKLEVTRPEMLIYAPGRDGKPDYLVAVEYVVPFRLLPSTAKPPRLFGQELRRHEEFKYWYLHVWAWKKNSAGLFSDWDPSIHCS
jgi:hypothetical protein